MSLHSKLRYVLSCYVSKSTLYTLSLLSSVVHATDTMCPTVAYKRLKPKLQVDLFSLYVLICFLISDNVMVPQRLFFQILSYTRASMCICMHNLRKDKDKLPWKHHVDWGGKQNFQVKKLYYYETFAPKSGPGCLHKVVIYEGFQL